ncbi:hypothetical protein IWX50DRAFT_630310 [Phyllosticta citricarpa]
MGVYFIACFYVLITRGGRLVLVVLWWCCGVVFSALDGRECYGTADAGLVRCGSCSGYSCMHALTTHTYHTILLALALLSCAGCARLLLVGTQEWTCWYVGKYFLSLLFPLSPVLLLFYLLRFFLFWSSCCACMH